VAPTTLSKSDNKKIHAVILAGGNGTRLWPISRGSLPKQFVSLFSDRTLLEETVSRLGTIVGGNDITIVTSATAAAGESMIHLAPYQLLLEPCSRNTAPAIAIAALKLTQHGEDPVMLVLPSDHMIQDVTGFQRDLRLALDEAVNGHLVTFGISPIRPETGYGYVQAGAATANDLQAALPVASFREKPDLETARRFLADGGYYWNSGMFVWRASEILRAIDLLLPELALTVDLIRKELAMGHTLEAAIRTHFASAPSISIDHGVLEKITSSSASVATAAGTKIPTLVLIPTNIGWSDVGSWDAVRDLSPKDADGNTLRGNVVVHDSHNIQIQGGKRLIAAVGLTDITIIDTPDALLVAKNGETQAVRHIVTELQNRNSPEHLEHITVQRPWGSFTVLEELPGSKIKRIDVKPGGRLSLQSHNQRSEHWVVVSGVATVTCGDRVYELSANQSTFIPAGAKHRLENLGSSVVSLIEVQIGKYLGEDDITRYDDHYGRAVESPTDTAIIGR